VLSRRARGALFRYRDAQERLQRLGVIRTDGPIAGQLGEWVAAQYLRLRLVRSNVQKGYDAVDSAGGTYQIKARLVSGPRTSTSFDFRRPIHRFDFLIGVLVSRTFDVVAIIRVPYVAVRRHARRNRGGYRLRWTQLSFASPWVEVLYLHDRKKELGTDGRVGLPHGRGPRRPKGK
jgi:hypothetical protein